MILHKHNGVLVYLQSYTFIPMCSDPDRGRIGLPFDSRVRPVQQVRRSVCASVENCIITKN